MASITVDTIRGYRAIRLLNPTTVRFELYLRPTTETEDVRHLALSTVPANFRAFSDWQHGASGAATYESANVPIQVQTEPSSLGHAFIQLDIAINQLKIFNDADRFTFDYLGDNYTCNIVEPEYIVQSGTRSYVNQSFNTYTLNPVLNATVDELANNKVRVTTNHAFPTDVASLYLDSITGLNGTRTTDYPRVITSARDVGELFGSYGSTANLTLTYKVGGAKSGNSLPLAVVLTRREGATTSPTVPDLSATRVRITNVESEHEGEVTVEFEITPTLTQSSGGEIRLMVDETMPMNRSLGRSSTSNLLRTSITRAGIQRGRSYAATVTYRKSATESFVSPTVFFRYGETLELQSDVAHLTQQLRTAKVFISDLTHRRITIDVIQDIFLSDFVERLYAKQSATSSTEIATVDNTQDNSLLSLSWQHDRPNAKLTVVIFASTAFGEVQLAAFNFRTLEGNTDQENPLATQTNSRRVVLQKGYDADILDVVEGLDSSMIETLVVREMDRMNSPENDGYLHDFNTYNKRGSIFGKQSSDLTKTKFNQVIDIALGSVSERVPDIDAGAPS